MKKTSLLILGLIGISLAANTARPVNYQGFKRAGMGGAGIAVIDKRESVFYNPAHAAVIGSTLSLPLIQGTTGIGHDTLSNISKLSTSGDTNDVLDAYGKIIPTKVGFSYATSGLWITPLGQGNLGLGMYSSNFIGGRLLNPISPRLEVVGNFDAVLPSVTYAFALNPTKNTEEETEEEARTTANQKPKVKKPKPTEEVAETPTNNSIFIDPKLGFTLKNISRTSLYDPSEDDDVLRIEVLNLIDQNNPSGLNYRTGSGLGFDLGGIAEMDTFMGRSTVGFSLLNIATKIRGTEYINANSDTNKTQDTYTQDIPMIGTIGIAHKAAIFKDVSILEDVFSNTTYAADLDIISPDTSFFKRLHLGLEQPYLDGMFEWRMGLNQGYPTMGINGNFGVYHIGLTYFTQELGSEIGQNPQSYYMLDGGFYW